MTPEMVRGPIEALPTTPEFDRLNPEGSLPDWAVREFPHVLPATWTHEIDLRWYILRRNDGLLVLATGAVYTKDHKRWLHVSASFRDKIPSHYDMAEVKDLVIGRERRAIHVYPPRSQHVNIHPNVLHLFSCIDDDGLPDFTEGTGSI